MHSFISYPYNITSIETDIIAYICNALIVATIQSIFEVSKAFPDHLHALPRFRFSPFQAAMYSLCIYIADKQLGICRLIYFSE